MNQSAWLLGSLLVATACSSGGDTTQTPFDPDGSAPNDADTKPDTSTSNDAATGPDSPSSTAYPSGPYGVSVGSTLANITWIGYPDVAADAIATTKPYVNYSLDDARKSGKKYLMINLAESYCPGCMKSAGELASGGPGVVSAGGVVIELLETTGFLSQASKMDLGNWINKYALPVTTVKDPDGTGTPSHDTLGLREHCYIVDLSNMKVLQLIVGDNSGQGATSGGKCLTAMHTLLGK